jgi:gluconolactonase
MPGAGGAPGSSGSPGSAGTPTGSGGSGGNGGGTQLTGGASAKFICPAGATYGNPLTGMGTPVTISAPTSGSVTYFAFIEGPIWIGSLGKLFFSDNVSPERIWQLAPPSTTPSVFLSNSGSNGMALDNNDQLLIADQANHRIVRIDPKTAMVKDTLVPQGNYKPNDLVYRSDGNLYFTDPDSAGKGFYRVSPAGMLTGPITAVGSPNGIELSPDENTLYVGDVNAKTITQFTLGADGSVDVGSGSKFATAMNTTVDGMAVDCAGNLYASTSNGVEVYAPSGSMIGTIPTGEVSNVTFGGSDRKTLYATCRSVLKAVTLAVPGLPD